MAELCLHLQVGDTSDVRTATSWIGFGSQFHNRFPLPDLPAVIFRIFIDMLCYRYILILSISSRMMSNQRFER